MFKKFITIWFCFLLGAIYLRTNIKNIKNNYSYFTGHNYRKNDFIFSMNREHNSVDSTISNHRDSEIINYYNDGILSSQRVENLKYNFTLIRNFNELGLIDGLVSFFFNENKKNLFNYKNNVLDGKIYINDNESSFRDGALSGELILEESKDSPVFFKGVPDFIRTLPLPHQTYSSTLIKDHVPNKYSGDMYSSNLNLYTLSSFKDGILIRKRVYSNYFKEILGIKKSDLFFYSNGQIKKDYMYDVNGVLVKLSSFNPSGELHGIQYFADLKNNMFFLSTYDKGILHGEAIQYVYKKDRSFERFLGFYSVGTFTGNKMIGKKIISFSDGVPFIDTSVFNEYKNLPKISNLLKIPNNFTGYNRIKNSIYEYIDGKVISSTTINNDSDISKKEYGDNFSYSIKDFSNGKLVTLSTFSSDSIQNGKFEEYIYNDSVQHFLGFKINNEIKGNIIFSNNNNIIKITEYSSAEFLENNFFENIEKQTITKGHIAQFNDYFFNLKNKMLTNNDDSFQKFLDENYEEIFTD